MVRAVKASVKRMRENGSDICIKDALRKEEGLIEDDKPRSLLYLMLRYAIELGYWDAGQISRCTHNTQW